MELDKLKFWKKKEESLPDFALPVSQEPKVEESTLGRGFEEPESFEKLATVTHAQPKMQPMPGKSRDVELISSKLDTIKANLDSINQRLENLERLAKEECKKIMFYSVLLHF